MIEKVQSLWLCRKRAVVVLLLTLGSAALLAATKLVSRSPSVPTFEVKPGEFLDTLPLRGEVKALKSVTLMAPAEAGTLQVVRIVADGSAVKPGDVVVEFDKTKTEQDLKQDRSTVKSAEAEIEQARAQARLTEEADTTELMKARYEVEKARLDAHKEEVVSRIEGEEAKLKLADAEQKLIEAEAKLKSDQTLDRANIESRIAAGRKAAFDAERAQRALTKMSLLAPVSGVISLISLWHPDGEYPLRPGDHAWAGAPIAELPDTSTLRITARVDETERSRVAPEQAVTAQFDAVPERQFKGHVEDISTLASSDFSGGWPFTRNFEVKVTLDQIDSRLKPGMTAQLTVIVDRIPNALSIPAQASFERSGQTVAYVWTGSKFAERVIAVERRSGDRILVEKGLRPGDLAALRDPAAKE
ncbi:MAG TPA: efflux RND transporter periplasmic adaptor subunit [Terriglobales bacterium]|nr:efflux RND transporter periplasmic adaptor subunit [Terriglobales bacterium]